MAQVALVTTELWERIACAHNKPKGWAKKFIRLMEDYMMDPVHMAPSRKQELYQHLASAELLEGMKVYSPEEGFLPDHYLVDLILFQFNESGKRWAQEIQKSGILVSTLVSL